VIKHRAYAQDIQTVIGGKATHPVCGLPGGVSKAISEEERREIEKMAESSVTFAQYTLNLFNEIVLKNKKYVELILSDAYKHRTYYMGTVDNNNNVYVAGITRSGNAIATLGAHQTVIGGNTDAFVVKFTSSGDRIWGTYYGGLWTKARATV
jgi:coenzyme F420-reducing hydrogenase alpha subunit